MLEFQLDLGEIRRARDVTIRLVKQGAMRAVSMAAVEGAEHARLVGRFKDHTHNLRTSIRAVQQTDLEWEIVAGGKDAPYARYVEEGTKPHRIEARHAKALRWVPETTSSTAKFSVDVRFARYVNHPGSKPYPFMGPAYIKAYAVAMRELEMIPDRVNRELGTA